MSNENMTADEAIEKCKELFKMVREYARETTKAIEKLADIGEGVTTTDMIKLRQAAEKLDRELGEWLE